MKPDRAIQWPRAVLTACAVLALLLSCPGCEYRQAQRYTSAAAAGVEETDERVALRYTAASQEALDAAESMTEFEERMQPWDKAEKAIRGARGSLFATQTALNTWRATGDRSDFDALAPCLATELVNLRRVLNEAGERIPEQLTTALDFAAAFGGGRCEEVSSE